MGHKGSQWLEFGAAGLSLTLDKGKLFCSEQNTSATYHLAYSYSRAYQIPISSANRRWGKEEHAGDDCFTFYRERMDSDFTTLDKESLCANNWSLPSMMVGFILMSISTEICSQSLDIPDSCNWLCSDRKINCQLASSDVLRSIIPKWCCPEICRGLTLAECPAPTKAAHSPSPVTAGQTREKFNKGFTSWDKDQDKTLQGQSRLNLEI